MISYIKFFVVCILLCSSSYSFAQETYYFEQIKIVKGNSETKGSGGQFISFYKDICYDSNNKGETVGFGMLDLVKNDNSNYIQYKGNSYWGKATYKFNKELTRLNIIVSDGTIYVYNKSAPPKGVTASSLTRSSISSSTTTAPSVSTYPPTIPRQDFQNTTGNSNSHHEKQVREKVVRETCRRCNGKKRIVINTYPSMFGLDDYKVRCNECGEYHLRSVGHSHIDCPDCGGKGYKEKKTYSYE